MVPAKSYFPACMGAGLRDCLGVEYLGKESGRIVTEMSEWRERAFADTPISCKVAAALLARAPSCSAFVTRPTKKDLPQ
jgi:hypothetical protein